MKLNLIFEKSLTNLSITERQSFIEVMGRIITSLAKDKMIVGLENVPKPFDKEMLCFVSQNSVEHLFSSEKNLYTKITYVLNKAEHVAECINLRRLSDVFLLIVTEKQPLYALKDKLQNKDVRWCKDNYSNFHALCFITTEQMLSLQIVSSYVGYSEVLELLLQESKNPSVNLEECEARLIFS